MDNILPCDIHTFSDEFSIKIYQIHYQICHCLGKPVFSGVVVQLYFTHHVCAVRVAVLTVCRLSFESNVACTQPCSGSDY